MAKKTTRSKTRRTRTRIRQAPNGERLEPKPDQLIVRMYRQGLGDCFLLAVREGESSTKYVLIDCGVHKRQDDGPARLTQVLNDLVTATGARIDVVVATHEHADHLSGFVQKGSPFLTDGITIGEVWMAWTEKRGDRQADALRRKRGTAQRVIKKAIKEARQRAGQGLYGAALAGHLEHLTDFDDPDEGAVDIDDVEKTVDRLKANCAFPTVADDPPGDADAEGLGVTKKQKARASTNELALALLTLKVGDNQAKYCEPGKVQTLNGVSNLRAYVLGPPRSDLLEKDKPTKIRGASEDDPGGAYKEVYIVASGGNRALALSPRFEQTATAGVLSDNWRFPFAERYRRRYDVKNGFDLNISPPPALATRATRTFLRESYFAPHAEWRRIDGEWLGAAEQLALDLASDTNNTSLALAFEWGPAGSGRVLLFAADAQVGNWLSWRDQPYGKRKLKVDSLLERVMLYKVGHHGSHNATVRRDPRDTSSSDPLGAPFGLELMNDIIAMIPVDEAAAKKEMPDPWKMPHEPLYRRLREKARRRVLRCDSKITPLDDRRDKPDLVPKRADWEDVPGLPGVRWRKSKDGFQKGTDGPLYYDVLIPLRD